MLPRPWLFLAPMAGVADWAFREICYEAGAEITVSHLVPVRGLLACPKRVLPEVGARHGDRPFIAQLLGCDPADFRRAAALLCDALPIVGIDINMGCPVSPVVNGGKGSALLRDPERAAEIVAEACAGSALPVSVKLRSGWDCPVVPELAPLLEAAGARALFVHGRTREQQFRGVADLAVIAATKRAVSIPVVGNGDVVSLVSARRMLAQTDVDGLMVGRGAVGNPWLFTELKVALKGCRLEALQHGPTIRQHARLAFEDQGSRAALTMRKHLIAYSRGSPSSASLRRALEFLSSRADIERWINGLVASGTAESVVLATHSNRVSGERE
jgi:tRNA-dihydrouridine synthase B